MGLAHGNGDHEVEIEPFPPGHYEEYDIAASGKATLVERRLYHDLECLPKWRNVCHNVHANGKRLRSILWD